MKHKGRMFFNLVAMALLADSVQPVKAQWVKTNGPFGGIIEALCVKDSTIFAGTDSGVFLSTDSGTSWIAANTGLAELNVKTLVVSGENIFAGIDVFDDVDGVGGGVYLSTNNGTSWKAVDSGLTDLHTFYLAASGNNLVARVGYGPLYESFFTSTNSGTTWTKVNSGFMKINCFAVNGNDIFWGTAGDGVFLSTNSGTNWTAVDSGLTDLWVYSLAVNGNNIFAGTWSDGVFLSTNSGTSWTAVNSGLTDRHVYNLGVSDGNIFAGTDSGVFLSTNNGTSWSVVDTVPWSRAYSLPYVVSGNNIYSGTKDSTVWRRPISDLNGIIKNPSRQISNNNYTFKISMSGAKASISFSPTCRERITFTIYNLSGHVVQSLAGKQFEPGPQTLFWNTRSLVPGCYMVKMRAGNKTYANNFTLVR
jgi:hypothetical protein